MTLLMVRLRFLFVCFLDPCPAQCSKTEELTLGKSYCIDEESAGDIKIETNTFWDINLGLDG